MCRRPKEYIVKGKTLREWSKELGVNYVTMLVRYKNGMTDEQILSTKRVPKRFNADSRKKYVVEYNGEKMSFYRACMLATNGRCNKPIFSQFLRSANYKGLTPQEIFEKYAKYINDKWDRVA